MHAAEEVSHLREELKREREIKADLLAACKVAEEILARMDTLRHLDPDFPALDTLRAAITRAEGRES